MQKLHASIFINAPAQKVWDTMLEDKTYREWTDVFTKGSHYEGSWEEGSKIMFLEPSGSGMVSRIAENRPYEYLSIEHVGLVADGVEDTTSEAARKWTPAHENYTFVSKDGGTELVIDMDIEEEYKAMFDDLWVKALQKLKEMCEV